MRAIAVEPGRAGSLHLREVPRPALEQVPEGRGVRVAIVRVGLCGTDSDILAGHYGRPPDDSDHLILGHEMLGRVLEVGPAVAGSLAVGQLVVVTIRRPGTSVYDRIGRPDLSTDETFIEAGISRLHGFLVEEVVEDARYLVPVPDEAAGVAVLTEPLSCVTKALRQADQVQSRLGLWEPGRALVLGAGTIGLLATLVLRLRGLEVTTYARRPEPHRNSGLVEALGARYLSAARTDLPTEVDRGGGFDIVFEGSGAATLLEPAVGALAPNGVLALFGVTPGSQRLGVDVAAMNQAMVLGNRVMVGSVSSSRDDHVEALGTLVRAESGASTRGWAAQLITTRIENLDVERVAAQLTDGKDSIKATVEIAARDR